MQVYCDKVSNIIDIKKDYSDKSQKKLLGQEILKKFKENIEADEELKSIFAEENEKEQQSWENSIPELLSVIAESGLADLFVVFEYELPVGKSRIDCTVIGRNADDEVCILIVELKQWVHIYNHINNEDSCKVKLTADDIVRQHPLAQIQTYSKYLENNHTFCEKDNVKIYKCAYLHNFEDKEELFQKPYDIYRKQFYYITFTKNDVEDFKRMLNEIFINKSSYEDVKAFCDGDYKIGKDGLEELHKILESNEAITLLEEQRDIIALFSKALISLKSDERIVEIISGNVGSGKTYLAFEMLRRALKRFKNVNCFYTLVNLTVRDIIEAEFNDKVAVHPSKATYKKNKNDIKNIVIIDEAHRVNNAKEIISKIIENTRIVIILQDDNQRVLFNEEGTRENYEEIIEQCSKYYKIKRLCENGNQLKLNNDLRTNARSRFIENLNKFLEDEIISDSNYISSLYDLKLMDNLLGIDEELKEKSKKYQCKWGAAFCWDWTYNTINNDIIIDNFKKAWNPSKNDKHSQYDWYKGKYEHHIDEVGCVYTLQGLDFDYTAVIFWDDLYWRNGKWNVNINKIKDGKFFVKYLAEKYGGIADTSQKNGHWIIHYKNNTYEINDFIEIISEEKHIDLLQEVVQIVKNIYRVLLSRAKKGMYVWFRDEETKIRFMKAFNL